MTKRLTVVEICAGAGGQSLGLHRAGFEHSLAVELDERAATTLRSNLKTRVAVGDVADSRVWDPASFQGIDLLAGGVPCPPFSSAGKQLGTSDERDLFAWAVEQVATVQPRALMLENVRGLASARFAAYRQRVIDRLDHFGYVADWRLLKSSDFGVPQLRPRFVLVAMKPQEAAGFRWPDPVSKLTTVGEALHQMMAANGWRHADTWSKAANGVGPTIVGGSKRHGGADLGPTRAKAGWLNLGVDGRGIANEPPGTDWPHPAIAPPRLTIPMVARLQGWLPEDDWQFAGPKTSQYRQIGNAFPPPVAEAVGRSIADALHGVGAPLVGDGLSSAVHDPLYQTLSAASDFISLDGIVDALGPDSRSSVRGRLDVLARDFDLEVKTTPTGEMYRLGAFKGFVGQADHERHNLFSENRGLVS